jgi:hypothetical protein
LPLTDTTIDGFKAQQPINTLDYRPAMRALLDALDRWVREGVEPPPNAVPLIAEATAVPRESIESTYRSIPGAAWLSHLPQRLRLDYGLDPDAGVLTYPPKEDGSYPVLVSAVDGDCNEITGIRLPDIAFPLATYTGWNVRHESMGSPGLMTSGAPLFGATLPFPTTRAQQEASGDPRTSVEERYESKEAYLELVRSAARFLIGSRLMLEEDIERVVDIASQKWDAFRA